MTYFLQPTRKKKKKRKPSTIAELRTTMQKIWNELAHQPVAKAVQNFRKRVKACANKAGEHFEHFI